MEWLEPWESLDASPAELREAYVHRLAVELAPGHPLFGVKVRAIGKQAGSDGVLFEILDGSSRVADVHLTWATGPCELPWPLWEIWPSLDAWVAGAMRPRQMEIFDEEKPT